MTRLAVVFEAFVRAGSQRHLLEILKGIQLFRSDVSCDLFLLASENNTWPTFIPEVKAAGIHVIQTPYSFSRKDGNGFLPRAHNWWSRHYRERSLNQVFYDSLAQYSIVVCAQPFVADLVLPHIKRNQRLCFHLSEHPSQRGSLGHYKFLQSHRLNIIFQHGNQVAQFRLAKHSTLTWPLRLCPDHFVSQVSQNADPDAGLSIAHYSRISPMRFIDRVIDAFALLHQQTPASLRIAGHIEDPAYHQALLAQIGELGLEGVVSFVDPVPLPAEDPDRDQVDLVWMISLSGHIGYAALEAMAAGFPTLLLEVDSPELAMPVDPELVQLICPTPQQLVDRSLALRKDPSCFREEQAQLMRHRFLTTKEGIDQLVGFYIGEP